MELFLNLDQFLTRTYGGLIIIAFLDFHLLHLDTVGGRDRTSGSGPRERVSNIKIQELHLTFIHKVQTIQGNYKL